MSRVSVLASVLWCCKLAPTWGADPNIARDLTNVDANGPVDVIIQYNRPVTAAHHQRLNRHTARHLGDLPLIRATHYSVPAASLEELAADPDVVAVSPDRPVYTLLDLTASAVGATLAQQQGWTGKGIGIALIDSGISYHYDLSSSGLPTKSGRLVYQESFVAEDADTGDHFGHGTHVAGVVAGNGWWSSGHFKGIAPAANLINLRVMNGSGIGTDSAVRSSRATRPIRCARQSRRLGRLASW